MVVVNDEDAYGQTVRRKKPKKKSDKSPVHMPSPVARSPVPSLNEVIQHQHNSGYWKPSASSILSQFF